MGYVPYAWKKRIGKDIADYDPLTAPGDADQIVLRQSEVANATLCPGRVSLARAEGVDLPPSEAMFFGTMMHRHIEDFIRDYEHGLSLDWITDFDAMEGFVYDEAISNGIVQIRNNFTSGTSWRMWIHEQMHLLNAWVEQWFLDNVHLIEESVVREVIQWIYLGTVKGSDTAVWLRGTPDLATPRLLVDWKTSGKGWSKGKAYGSIQDDVYAGLLRHNHGLEIGDALFVVGNRSSRRWEEHPTRVTEASIESAMFRAFSVAESLVLGANVFVPTTSFGQRSWHCRPEYCSVWDRCQAKCLGDSYDVQPIEVRKVWK